VSLYPSRIVCLTEETTETLYLLGEGHRVVGISGYTLRPPEARQKPKVSSFISARYDKIAALEPDLILTFSDLQADIAAELIRRGLPVCAFNQRSVAEILQMIRTLAGLIGCEGKGQALAAKLETGLSEIRMAARTFPMRPRVFFEEWPDPLISGIRWVEELVEIAGGEPVFPELQNKSLAKDRIIHAGEVAKRNPELVLASWCGKKVKTSVISSRAGWSDVAAVRNGHIYEIPSTYILQPGPAALTEGVRQVHARLALVANGAHSTVTFEGINRLS
jgi:iron complex transport system substrate-binding protein